MVKVYYAHTSVLDECYEYWYARVSAARREKIDAYRQEKDKRLSLLSEVLLIKALEDLGVVSDTLEFEYGEHGKPSIVGVEGIYYNISHSGDVAVCAIADCPVGVDVELIDKYNEKVAKRFFHKKEYEDLTGIEDEVARKRRFFQYWTLSESFIKYVGTGLSMPLDSFYFTLDDGIRIHCEGVEALYFTELAIDEGFCGALCVEKAQNVVVEEVVSIN